MTRLIAAIGLLIALAAGAYVLMGPSQPGSTQITSLIGSANAQEASDIDTSSVVEMTLGAEDAPVTIIEYASFTCPHCAAFNQGPYKQLKKDYIDTGKVKLIYRDVYFDKYGLWASMIARCGGPEKFFGIADLIYKDQSEWARGSTPQEIVDGLRKIGRMAGMDDAQLDACLQDGEKAQTLVAWYQKNAEADQVTGTPSFIVNGKPVKNQAYADFAKVIDAELGE